MNCAIVLLSDSDGNVSFTAQHQLLNYKMSHRSHKGFGKGNGIAHITCDKASKSSNPRSHSVCEKRFFWGVYPRKNNKYHPLVDGVRFRRWRQDQTKDLVSLMIYITNCRFLEQFPTSARIEHELFANKGSLKYEVKSYPR